MSGSLFAYGSLMFPEVWKRVLGSLHRRSEARLHRWKRVRMIGRDYPGLIPGDDCVDGCVWHDLREEDWERLDHFEGEEYKRVPVDVELVGENSRVRCHVYASSELCSGILTGEPWMPEPFKQHSLRKFMEEYPGFFSE